MTATLRTLRIGNGAMAAALAAVALFTALAGSAAAQGPSGFRAWVSDIHDQDDKPAAGEPATVQMVGPSNGTCSGKVVASSDKPIRNLKAACGALKGPGGAIAASQIQIRYGLPWAARRARRTPNACLAEAPLDEYPAGAGAPVWITVTVPRDARPGLYAGELAVTAEGEHPVRVPVRLKVVDWMLPDPGRYASWVDFIQASDTSAVEYGVPLWSPKHWEYITRSLELLGELGNKTLYIPLIGHTHIGNEESMVRWIDKGQGKYEHDFSIVDKYLDLAERHMGKPEVVVLVVWELYMLPQSDAMTDDEARRAAGSGNRGRKVVHARQASNIQERGGKLGMGPLVTLVAPSGGKSENVYLPPYADPASKALWAPLVSAMRQRLEKRGLGPAMMLGICSDAWPSKEELTFFNDLTGGAPWVVQSHYGFPDSESKLMHGIARIGYQTRVWGGIRFADGQSQTNQQLPPSAEAQLGWKGAERVAVFERNAGLDVYPVARWRFFVETCITSTARGVGRLGGDFWYAVKNKQGKRAGDVADRFPEAHWRNLNVCNSILAPAPEGPAATDRFEAFREGLQECEARIAIERALSDDGLRARLGDDLARRAQDVLDERLTCMWKSLSQDPDASCRNWRWHPGTGGHAWFLKSGWQERSEKLYGVAGEVERKLAAR